MLTKIFNFITRIKVKASAIKKITEKLTELNIEIAESAVRVNDLQQFIANLNITPLCNFFIYNTFYKDGIIDNVKRLPLKSVPWVTKFEYKEDSTIITLEIKKVFFTLTLSDSKLSKLELLTKFDNSAVTIQEVTDSWNETLPRFSYPCIVLLTKATLEKVKQFFNNNSSLLLHEDMFYRNALCVSTIPIDSNVHGINELHGRVLCEYISKFKISKDSIVQHLLYRDELKVCQYDGYINQILIFDPDTQRETQIYHCSGTIADAANPSITAIWGYLRLLQIFESITDRPLFSDSYNYSVTRYLRKWDNL